MMIHTTDLQFDELQERAEEAADFLKQLANKRRLVILCRLVTGKATVSELCDLAGLSHSAMSQHLAKMRAEGLVQGTKDGLQVYYSISDARCLGILQHLKSGFCSPTGNPGGL